MNRILQISLSRNRRVKSSIRNLSEIVYPVGPIKSRPLLIGWQKCAQLMTFTLQTNFMHKSVTKISTKSFHTSSRRKIPAFLLIIVSSIMKVGGVASAGILRLIYARLDKNNKAEYLKKIKKYWYIFLGGSFSSVVSGTTLYSYCTEPTPITGRKRWMFYTKNQRTEMAKAQAAMLRKHFKLTPENVYLKTDPKHIKVQTVADKLLVSNPELQKRIERCKVYVIKEKHVNAHALADGHIFVSDAMLKLASTPDQIATLLSHELAHAILEHAIEKLAHGSVMEDMIIAGIGVLCLVLPDGETARNLRGKIIRMQLQRPYTKEMEDEADIIGVRFAANACCDIREGIVLWRKMAEYQKRYTPSEDNAEWTWTHPNCLERAAHIETILDEAQQWRKDKNCPDLPTTDPRDNKVKLPPAKHDWYRSSLRKGQMAVSDDTPP